MHQHIDYAYSFGSCFGRTMPLYVQIYSKTAECPGKEGYD